TTHARPHTASATGDQGPSRRAERPGAATRPPRLRYAALAAPPSRSFGHGRQCLPRLLLTGPGEGEQRGGGEPCLLDRGRRILLEVAGQPPSSDQRMAGRGFPRDQRRQLERIVEAELRQLTPAGQT